VGSTLSDPIAAPVRGISETQRAKIITASALVVMATAILAAIQKGKGLPSMRFFVAFGFLFAACSVVNDLGSSLGAAFALIIMVAMLLENLPDVLAYVTTRLDASPTTGVARDVQHGAQVVQGEVTAPTVGGLAGGILSPQLPQAGGAAGTLLPKQTAPHRTLPVR
jgi:hypothetical protein